MTELDIIVPDWDAPENVTALCTTRLGGVSEGSYASLNLADHVTDNEAHVAENRRRLVEALGLPAEPAWLEQTHSIRAIDLDSEHERNGDAALTRRAGTIAVVMTADCLPVLLCNSQGTEVAAAHAGWRGLLNGVVEQAVVKMQSSPSDVFAWLGPAIGPRHFEVGDEVRQAFLADDTENMAFFSLNCPGHYLADLYAIARRRLNKLGINHISGGEYCTYDDSDRLFSYRRNQHCGRQASLIYFT